jgi:hypothetical protein
MSHIMHVLNPPPMVAHVLCAIVADVGNPMVDLWRTMSTDGKDDTQLVNCPMLAMPSAMPANIDSNL